MPRNTYNAVTIDNAIEWGHPLNRGRVAWWMAPPGIAAAGSRVLDLCGRNHGSLVNGPTWTPTGRGDSGLAFNGTSQYVSVPGTNFNLTAGYTWSMWVNGTAAPGAVANSQLLSVGTSESWGFSWSHTTAAFRQAAFHQDTASNYFAAAVTATLSAGVWYRITVVWTGSALKCYLNGAIQSTTTGVSSVKTTTGSVSYARSEAGAASYFDGKIGGPTVWNWPWSDAGIALDYRQSLVGYRVPNSPLRWVRGVRYFAPLSVGPQTRFFPSMAGMGWC